MSIEEMETQRHRLRRLRILQTLYMNRPAPMGDGLIRQSLKHDIDLAFTQSNVRRGLEYLEGRNLVALASQTDTVWVVKITPDGIDYIDGLGPDIAGVARPSEF